MDYKKLQMSRKKPVAEQSGGSVSLWPSRLMPRTTLGSTPGATGLHSKVRINSALRLIPGQALQRVRRCPL